MSSEPKQQQAQPTPPPNQSAQPKPKFTTGLIAGGISGLVSAVLTQPFEVLKTALLVNPTKNQVIDRSNMFSALLQASKEVYRTKNRGILNYLLGSEMSILRQCIGFATYSYLIETFNMKLKGLDKQYNIPQYILFGSSAACAKVVVMTITVPLTILKTRFELIHYKRQSIPKEIQKLLVEGKGWRGIAKGLDTLITREVTFSIFQYSSYRYLRYLLIERNQLKFKDQKGVVVQKNTIGSYLINFIPGYFSGLFGSLMSQPFEVVRNRIMIDLANLQEKHQYKGLIHGIQKIIQTDGMSGWFRAILPSLMQKPIRICITWGLFEIIKKKRMQKQLQK